MSTFHFDTVDEIDNAHPGWFIDDLYVGPGAPYGGGGNGSKEGRGC